MDGYPLLRTIARWCQKTGVSKLFSLMRQSNYWSMGALPETGAENILEGNCRVKPVMLVDDSPRFPQVVIGSDGAIWNLIFRHGRNPNPDCSSVSQNQT